MSFLGPDDDLAVLEQALAFIDEFADAPVAVEGGGVPGSPLDVSDAASTVTAIKKKKRERNPEVDSRRRLRRKEERLALHRQVKELQRELAKTRQAFQPTAAVREPRAAKRRALRWLELLLEEQRRLETSRALNTQLKEVLSTQIALGNKLQEFADRFSPSVRGIRVVRLSLMAIPNVGVDVYSQFTGNSPIRRIEGAACGSQRAPHRLGLAPIDPQRLLRTNNYRPAPRYGAAPPRGGHDILGAAVSRLGREQLQRQGGPRDRGVR